MYIPVLLQPKPGDIIERWTLYKDELVGIFIVVNPRMINRDHLMEVWCLFNSMVGYEFTIWKDKKAGTLTKIHREKLIGKYAAQRLNTHEYYTIRQK